MKRNVSNSLCAVTKLFLFCYSFLFVHEFRAVSLDGSTGSAALYVSSSYAFASGDYARGFVYFDQGFIVPAGGTVTIGIHPPVKLGVWLNGTGLMILTQDLYLAPGASLFGGGSLATNPPIPGTEINITQQGGAVTVLSDCYRILNDLVWNGGGAILNVDSPTLFQSFAQQPGFLVYPGATMIFENVNLIGWSLSFGLDYTPVRFISSNQLIRSFVNINLIFDNCQITTLLDSRTTYSNCQIFIKDTTIDGRGSIFNLKAPKVIPENIYVNPGVTFTYTPTTRYLDTTYGLDSFGMEVFDGISLENCQFTTTVPLKCARGYLRVAGLVDFTSTATAKSDRILQIGEQSLGKQCALDILPGGRMRMHDMLLKYDDTY